MKRQTYRTPHEIAVKGFEALVEKLGPGGAIRFIHQYETGRGDYTKESRAILKWRHPQETPRRVAGDKMNRRSRNVLSVEEPDMPRLATKTCQYYGLTPLDPFMTPL